MQVTRPCNASRSGGHAVAAGDLIGLIGMVDGVVVDDLDMEGAMM
jgi:hypothetical protein